MIATFIASGGELAELQDVTFITPENGLSVPEELFNTTGLVRHLLR